MDTTSERIPLWLDCDPGHDDAFAILLAAYHPRFNLLGISAVHGNSSVAHTTENAGRVLTAIGRPEIPVFKGAARGLTRPAVHASVIHGESGLDGTSLLPVPAVPAITTIDAHDAIAESLLSTPPQSSWLVATGTLTNIAQLFITYPQLASHIKGLSIMGGAIGGSFTNAPLGKVGSVEWFGNWTPYGEFNIVCDPEAASVIFSNKELAAKTTLIPLDVTHQVLVTKSVENLLLFGSRGAGTPSPSKLRVMLVELLRFFRDTYAEVFGITEGPPLHDPLAVAAVLDGIAGFEVPFYDYVEGKEKSRERYQVSIITEGTYEEALRGDTQTGRTMVKHLEEGEAGVKIPRGLDVPRFWKVLEECLRDADEKNRLDNAELR